MTRYISILAPEYKLPEQFHAVIFVSRDENKITCTVINEDTKTGSAIDGDCRGYANDIEAVLDTILDNIMEVA